MKALCDNANCTGYAGISNKDKNEVHFQIIYSLLSDLKYSLKWRKIPRDNKMIRKLKLSYNKLKSIISSIQQITSKRSVYLYI